MLLRKRALATDTAVLEAQSAHTGPEKLQKWRRWAVPVAALVVGIGIGGAGGDPTQSEEYRMLSTEIETIRDDIDEATDEAAKAAALTQEMEAENTRLNSEVRTLRASAQATKAPPTEATAAPAAAAGAAAKPVPATPVPVGKPAPAPAPTSSAAPPAPQSTATYYENCTAARAAGAAPLSAGEPGYGKHLDRDGDGIGCDS